MKKLIIFFLAFINCFLFLGNTHVVANAETSVSDDIIINQSVDDDLAEFNFDWERYCVGEDKYYQPIMINYRESLSRDSLDLLYFYILDNYEIRSIDVDIYVGNDINSLEYYSSESYKLYKAGSNDLDVYRYAFDGYDSFRNVYKYRRYNFNFIKCFSDNKYINFNLNNFFFICS